MTINRWMAAAGWPGFKGVSAMENVHDDRIWDALGESIYLLDIRSEGAFFRSIFALSDLSKDAGWQTPYREDVFQDKVFGKLDVYRFSASTFIRLPASGCFFGELAEQWLDVLWGLRNERRRLELERASIPTHVKREPGRPGLMSRVEAIEIRDKVIEMVIEISKAGKISQNDVATRLSHMRLDDLHPFLPSDWPAIRKMATRKTPVAI